jgi:hypothetical protein
MPVSVIMLGLFFNVVNAYLNGRFLFTLSNGYPDSWLVDPRFVSGIIIFIVGYAVNKQSDHVLRSLGRESDGSYRIQYVLCIVDFMH